MKNILFFLTFGLLSALSSCSSDCIDDVIGTYEGTETCPGETGNLVMVLSASSSEDQVVFAVGNLTFNGELSSDCESITVPNQNVSLDGIPGNIDGSFTVSGNNLNGSLTFSTGDVCSYSLTRQ